LVLEEVGDAVYLERRGRRRRGRGRDASRGRSAGGVQDGGGSPAPSWDGRWARRWWSGDEDVALCVGHVVAEPLDEPVPGELVDGADAVSEELSVKSEWRGRGADTETGAWVGERGLEPGDVLWSGLSGDDVAEREEGGRGRYGGGHLGLDGGSDVFEVGGLCARRHGEVSELRRPRCPVVMRRHPRRLTPFLLDAAV
jgi:hypothetical protein